jgi:hypothetical protein
MEELFPSEETICPTLDVHPSMEVLEQYVVPPTATTCPNCNADPSMIDIKNGRAVPL